MPRQRLRSILKMNLQASGASTLESLQSQTYGRVKNQLPLNGLGTCSRTTGYNFRPWLSLLPFEILARLRLELRLISA